MKRAWLKTANMAMAKKIRDVSCTTRLAGDDEAHVACTSYIGWQLWLA